MEDPRSGDSVIVRMRDPLWIPFYGTAGKQGGTARLASLVFRKEDEGFFYTHIALT